MKSLPVEIQSLYPCADGQEPDRPWWRRGWFAHNTEGCDVYIKPSRYKRCDGKRADTREEISDIDEKYPLPHPGFRVGQVWGCLNEKGQIRVQTIVEQLNEHLTLIDPRQSLSAKKQEYGGDFWVGDWFNGFFLLADPACPHLAPWAPSGYSGSGL